MLGEYLHRFITHGVRMSLTAFAKSLGHNNAAMISRVINGHVSNPGADLYVTIKTKYPSASLDFLLLGVGPMFEDEKKGGQPNDIHDIAVYMQRIGDSLATMVDQMKKPGST